MLILSALILRLRLDQIPIPTAPPPPTRSVGSGESGRTCTRGYWRRHEDRPPDTPSGRSSSDRRSDHSTASIACSSSRNFSAS